MKNDSIFSGLLPQEGFPRPVSSCMNDVKLGHDPSSCSNTNLFSWPTICNANLGRRIVASWRLAVQGALEICHLDAEGCRLVANDFGHVAPAIWASSFVLSCARYRRDPPRVPAYTTAAASAVQSNSSFRLSNCLRLNLAVPPTAQFEAVPSRRCRGHSVAGPQADRRAFG
jgi:hypothetical protein